MVDSPLRLPWVDRHYRLKEPHTEKLTISLEGSDIESLQSLLDQLWAVKICPSKRAREFELAK